MELKQGERVVEAKIAKSLNVSITPVREAFATLAAQGLLSAIPYCGTYVSILTNEYACELIEVRKSLETAAVTLAFPNLKPEDADYLEELALSADEKNEQGDFLGCIENDIAIHEFFFQKANNKLLLELWEITKNRTAFFQSVTRFNCQATVRLLSERHRGIIEAVRYMNLDKIHEEIIKHLDVSLQRAALPKSEYVNYK